MILAIVLAVVAAWLVYSFYTREMQYPIIAAIVAVALVGVVEYKTADPDRLQCFSGMKHVVYAWPKGICAQPKLLPRKA
jgi:hypothetical protein